jgi:hypothetical protein
MMFQTFVGHLWGNCVWQCFLPAAAASRRLQDFFAAITDDQFRTLVANGLNIDPRLGLEADKSFNFTRLRLQAAKDVEPEYVAVDDKDMYAYVTLQENNAIAKVGCMGCPRSHGGLRPARACKGAGSGTGGRGVGWGGQNGLRDDVRACFLQRLFVLLCWVGSGQVRIEPGNQKIEGIWPLGLKVFKDGVDFNDRCEPNAKQLAPHA